MDFYNTTDLPANLADESFAANLLRLSPNGTAKIFGLTGLAKTIPYASASHMWFTKKQRFPVLTLSSAALAGDTTLNITPISDSGDGNLDYIKSGAVLRVEHFGVTMSFEHLYVVDVDRAADTIDVIRGFGGTTPAAIATTETIIKIGNAFGQGSNAPSPTTFPMQEYVNYNQIVRDSWGVARTANQIKLRAGLGTGIGAENKRDSAFQHAVAIEQIMIFGRRGTTTDLEGNPMTLCGGIEQMITDMAPGNLVTADSAGTSFKDIESYLDPLLDYKVDGMGPSYMNIYCGKTALKTFNDLGKMEHQCQITPEKTSFGQRFVKFQTTRGEFNLIEHPMFNTNPNWAKMALVLDTGVLDLLYLQKTMHEDIEQVGKDSKGGVFTTEFTLQMKNAFSSGIIYNLTSASAA